MEIDFSPPINYRYFWFFFLQYTAVDIFACLSYCTIIFLLNKVYDLKYSRLKPTIRSKSVVGDVQRCTTKSADLTGEFNVTEARLTVEAFGLSIW